MYVIPCLQYISVYCVAVLQCVYVYIYIYEFYGLDTALCFWCSLYYSVCIYMYVYIMVVYAVCMLISATVHVTDCSAYLLTVDWHGLEGVNEQQHITDVGLATGNMYCTHVHTLSLSLTHSHTFTLDLAQSHIFSLTYSHSISQIYTYSHTCILKI